MENILQNNNRKANKVMKILYNIRHRYGLKGYIMFDDNWISENDRILYDENGNSFSVLDFKEVEDNMLLIPGLMPFHSTWTIKKFSCVKIDKIVSIGDVFYV